MVAKTRKKTRRPALADPARTGLIPASDDITVEAKARLSNATRVIQTMRRSPGCSPKASDERVITDILADLRLYSATRGFPFEDLDHAAELDNEEFAGMCGENWPQASICPSTKQNLPSTAEATNISITRTQARRN
jgi:hypothetical protein